MIYEEILLYHYKDFKENYEKNKAAKRNLIQHIINNDNSKIVIFLFNCSLIKNQMMIMIQIFDQYFSVILSINL